MFLRLSLPPSLPLLPCLPQLAGLLLPLLCSKYPLDVELEEDKFVLAGPDLLVFLPPTTLLPSLPPPLEQRRFTTSPWEKPSSWSPTYNQQLPTWLPFKPFMVELSHNQLLSQSPLPLLAPNKTPLSESLASHAQENKSPEPPKDKEPLPAPGPPESLPTLSSTSESSAQKPLGLFILESIDALEEHSRLVSPPGLRRDSKLPHTAKSLLTPNIPLAPEEELFKSSTLPKPFFKKNVNLIFFPTPM